MRPPAHRLPAGALRRVAAAALAGAVWGAADPGHATTTRRPASGAHAVQLCSASGQAPLGCSAARAVLDPDGALSLRLDDLVYRLQPLGREAAVLLLHNTVQIDAFRTRLDWSGATLRFAHPELGTRYEVRFAPSPGPH